MKGRNDFVSYTYDIPNLYISLFIRQVYVDVPYMGGIGKE